MEWKGATGRLAVLSILAICMIPAGPRSSRAGDDTAPLYDSKVAELVTAERFPDQCAVILLDRRAHTWSFGETTIERQYALKILTPEGIERYGDFISGIFPEEDVEYRLEAAVVPPAGGRREVPAKDVRKVPFGRGARQYRLALPGLEPGVVVEIRETVKYEYAIAFGSWDFSHDVPTLRSELVFSIPAGTLAAFTFRPKEARITPAKRGDGKYEVHTLSMEIVQPYANEPLMPPGNAGNPTVCYRVWQVTMEDFLRFHDVEYDESMLQEWMEQNEIPWNMPLATKSWKELAKAYEEYFNPDTWKKTKRADEYRGLLSGFAKELPLVDSSQALSVLDGLLAEFHERFQTIEYDFYYRNPERSLQHREGDQFESAYVLRRILERSGVQSSVVLASDVAAVMLDERIPDPTVLRRPLLRVAWGGELYWIDPSSASCPVGRLPWRSQGVRALWLRGADDFSFVTTPLDAAPVNCISRLDEIGIDEGGTFSGSSRIVLTGQYLIAVRREIGAAGAEARSEALRAFVEGIFPDEIEVNDLAIETDTRDTLIVRCAASNGRLGSRSGDYLQIDPSKWSSDQELRAFDAESRKFDIIFPFPATLVTSIRIAVPPGHAVEYLPLPVTHQDEWFAYSRIFRADGGAVVLTRKLAVTASRVDARAYGEAREAVEKIRKTDKESIVLKRSS